MINYERLKEHLLELVQIDSHSKEEYDVAMNLKMKMEELKADELWIDDAGEKVGGNVGNVVAKFNGSVPGSQPIFLSAHMDTVVPGKGVKPVVEGNIVRTDGTTILGGDDKSGCAVICEVMRVLKENDIPHSDIEIVFTICEEVGLLGAKNVDMSKLKSKFGLVLDSDDIGFLFTKGPSAYRMDYTIHGLEAHAGVCPEDGISAIKIASEAISAMKLGRVDEETTANIGVIEGGMATNIIPNFVLLKGEARSLNEHKLEIQVEHMRKCLQEAAERYSLELGGKTHKGRVEEDIHKDYDKMDVSDDSHIVKLVKQAGANLGQMVETMGSGGGCDANVFNKKGIETANLGTGMRDIHTVKEWLNVEDLYKSADIVFEIVKLNSQVK